MTLFAGTCSQLGILLLPAKKEVIFIKVLPSCKRKKSEYHEHPQQIFDMFSWLVQDENNFKFDGTIDITG
jgi:hypothetical protein